MFTDVLSPEAQLEFPEGWAFAEAIGYSYRASCTFASGGGCNRSDY